MTNGSHIQFEEGPDGSVKCPLFYEDIVLKASQFSNNTYPTELLLDTIDSSLVLLQNFNSSTHLFFNTYFSNNSQIDDIFS